MMRQADPGGKSVVPLLLLLLLLLLQGWTLASSPESPERLLYSASAARGSGAICPCAHLERGGFWSSDVAAALGIKDGLFTETRCRCPRGSSCERRWRRSERSLSVRWIGASGVRDSEMQLQFCRPTHPAGLPTCGRGQVTFRLRQIGWWLDVQAVLCRCPQQPHESENAVQTLGNSIHSFIYERQAAASRAATINSRLVEFVCEDKPTCQQGSPCYFEPVGPVGQAVRGSVLCSCPPGAFCPIYLSGRGVVPAADDAPAEPDQLVAANSVNASETAGLSLLCRLEPQA